MQLTVNHLALLGWTDAFTVHFTELKQSNMTRKMHQLMHSRKKIVIFLKYQNIIIAKIPTNIWYWTDHNVIFYSYIIQLQLSAVIVKISYRQNSLRAPDKIITACTELRHQPSQKKPVFFRETTSVGLTSKFEKEQQGRGKCM